MQEVHKRGIGVERNTVKSIATVICSISDTALRIETCFLSDKLAIDGNPRQRELTTPSTAPDLISVRAQSPLLQFCAVHCRSMIQGHKHQVAFRTLFRFLWSQLSQYFLLPRTRLGLENFTSYHFRSALCSRHGNCACARIHNTCVCTCSLSCRSDCYPFDRCSDSR